MAESETDFGTPCPHCGSLPCVDGTRIHQLVLKVREHADRAKEAGRVGTCSHAGEPGELYRTETLELVQAVHSLLELVEVMTGWKR